MQNPSIKINQHTDYLPVMEYFYTIQGEGANSGKPCYFIRLGGCDVGCHWCDVKESWDSSIHPMMSIQEICDIILKSKAIHVVITGGEPLMHNLENLTNELHQHNLNVYLETSGAHSFSGQFDWVCLSPKKFKKPYEEAFQIADELKIIVYNQSDLAWGLELSKKVKSHCKLFFQPEWSREKEMLPLIIEFVKKHPHWSISLQTHKYMNIP